MSNQAANIASASIMAALNGVLVDAEQRGKFVGLNFGSNMNVAAGPDGFLNVDGAAAVTPGLPLNSLQWNSAGSFAGHPTYSRSGDGVAVQSAAGTGFLSFNTTGSNPATEGLLRTDQAHQAILLVREFFDGNDIAFLWRTGNALYIGADNGSTRRSSSVNLDATNGIVLSAQGIQKLVAGIAQISANVPIVLANGQYAQFGTTSPAASGDLRGRNGFRIVVRNGTDANDVDIASLNIADVLILGDADAQGLVNRVAAGSTITLAQIGGSDYLAAISSQIQAGAPHVGMVGTSSPWGVHGKSTFAMADANHTLSATEYINTVIEPTGALTVDRDLVFPTPTNAQTYWKMIRNTCTNGGAATAVVAKLAAGTTVSVLFGTTAIVGFHAAGAFRITADAIH